MNDVVIVGTGASGVLAALQLCQNGLKPLLLDVGHSRDLEQPTVDGNFYEYRESTDAFDLMIGPDLRGLANLLGRRQVPVKLNSPSMEYVTRRAEQLGPIDQRDFSAIQSFASGGLANAWGGGMYPFRNRDLLNSPITEQDLDPYFRKLEKEMGISGANDDLTSDFGRSEFLLPPLRVSRKISKIYSNYGRKRGDLPGLRVGMPRVGVLSRPKGERPACEYDSMEFWQPRASIYSPLMTLDRLAETNQIAHRKGLLVKSWREEGELVIVEALDLATDQQIEIRARKLLLAAGCINSSKIVLQSFDDHKTKLPLLDTPALQIPLLIPSWIGGPLETTAFGLVQLNLFWETEQFDAPLFGSLMEVTSPARAEFFASLPFSAHANLALIKYLLPAMLVMQLFFPTSKDHAGALSLNSNGRLSIDGQPDVVDVRSIKKLLGYLRKMGAWTHPSLFRNVPMGHALHYSSTLPMCELPQSYQCDRVGRLHGTSNVFLVDGSVLGAGSGKNTSFTMMANAMRIAEHVSDEVQTRV